MFNPGNRVRVAEYPDKAFVGKQGEVISVNKLFVEVNLDNKGGVFLFRHNEVDLDK